MKPREEEKRVVEVEDWLLNEEHYILYIFEYFFLKERRNLDRGKKIEINFCK